MVKVTAEITLDSLTNNGRVLGIRVESDDEFINKLLNAPFIYSKTYPVNLPTQIIRKKFKQDISARKGVNCRREIERVTSISIIRINLIKVRYVCTYICA